jgi:hypothetical protein
MGKRLDLVAALRDHVADAPPRSIGTQSSSSLVSNEKIISSRHQQPGSGFCLNSTC